MAISVRSIGEPSVLASQKPSIIATLLFFLASALFPWPHLICLSTAGKEVQEANMGFQRGGDFLLIKEQK